MAAPDVSTPARFAAVQFEDLIRSNAVESGALIAPDGSYIALSHGTGNKVTFTVAELSRVADVTFTHNHPQGFGPSLEDAELAAEFELRELRVVTSSHRYRLGPWSRAHKTLLQVEFPIAQARAYQACMALMVQSQIHLSDVGIEVRHRTWERLSQQLNIPYTREPS